MADSQQVLLPDIGDFKDVEVIEIVVKPGDRVASEDPLVTLESDKATLDVPAPFGGVVDQINVKVGDRVSQGSLIALISPGNGGAPAEAPAVEDTQPASSPAPAPAAAAAPPAASAAARTEPGPAEAAPAAAPPPKSLPADHVDPSQPVGRATLIHASPSIRRYGRELGVDLIRVTGTGPKGRIQKTDVNAYVKGALQSPAPGGAAGGLAVARAPEIDFAKFGETESKPLSRIRRLTAQNLHRSWVTAPHVTQFNEADITALEDFRKAAKADADKRGVKLTMVSFLMKAAVAALQRYPDFNASLAADGESLIYKKYFNLGVAVNTEQGLVVPVIRDVDRKGLLDLAGELQEMTTKARNRKLSPADMEGGCFTISSLGGIGGTQFTPIINLPEVAILGVSRAAIRPVYENGQFVPRLVIPFSLSYDHRVIDGVAAAEFAEYYRAVLTDIRQVLL